MKSGVGNLKTRVDLDPIATFCGLVLLFALVLSPMAAFADIHVTVSGPGGSASQDLPDAGGAFDLNLPLNRNAVNPIVVTATDAQGNAASAELAVTQVSLDQIVVSQVTSERLSVEEVEQLVADGVIDIEDPENYNVSTFDIVLTIDQRPVPISLPIAIPVSESEESGYETYHMPTGDQSSGQPKPPPVQVVVFEQPLPSPAAPGDPAPPSIPGVIIIEGNIKSLKEFFNVRLLLMNRSGIFTLSDVMTEIELPEGALSAVLPADGINSFGDILPGDGDQPGQKEKEFIIRGDAIGVHDVTVNFGGTVTGPGISEPIAFNGSATTEVEVKGPPTFLVEVTHPDTVTAGEPYELLVDITNTGELTAMYASLELDVGADAMLENCQLDENGDPLCEYEPGGQTRPFGHIEPGETVRETFMVNPLASGGISSCVAAADQNITLNVYMGAQGCLVGQYPPKVNLDDGIPTVTVVPAANTTGVHADTAVTAFFSTVMNTATIVTGDNGSFNVFDSAGERVPGVLRFESLFAGTDNEKTIAIWQVDDGDTNRLAANAEYSVVVTTAIVDDQGTPLANRWESRFTTTDTGLNDTTAPTVSMSVAPPVNPNAVLPGEIVKLNAYAADAGSGISRVEMRLLDMDTADAAYELIGQKTVFQGDLPPFIFAIDSGNLAAGHAYQAMATAYDGMGNAQSTTLALILLDSAGPPTVTLPADLPGERLQGIRITLQPEISPGVRRVAYFLDGSTAPYKTITLAPFQASLGTLDLALGTHTITVVATDGLAQQGSAVHTFSLVENPNQPIVGFNGNVDGSVFVSGASIQITGTAEDPVGIAALAYYLDDVNSDPIYSGFAPILLNTTGLALGGHTVYVQATNLLNVSSDIADAEAAFEFTVVELPSGPPPAAPTITEITHPVDGLVTVSGTSVANAQLALTNLDSGAAITVFADAGGHFTAELPAETGQEISIVAYDLGTSQDASAAATATAPSAPVLTMITIAPLSLSFDTAGAYADLTVTGHYADDTTADLTALSSFASANAAVAAVSAAGRVVAQSYGSTTITASLGGLSAQAAVDCDIISLTSITVAPEQIALVSLGQTETLTVTGHYTDGTQETLSSGLAYVTGDPDVATVTSAGVMTAMGNGATSVNISYPGVPAVAVPVSVDTALDPPPTATILSPADNTVVERAQSITLTVQAADSNGGLTRIYLETSGETTVSEIRQIAPPLFEQTEAFTFSIAEEAFIGGTILVRTWAEDTSGNTSEIDTITLLVADTTAPQVTLTAPAPLTPYNFGDTVHISISAQDLGGLGQIRFETSGALVRTGSLDLSGEAQAQADFSIEIPYEVSASELRIQAYASDIYGQEAAAVPVDVVLTDADVTPPETLVTAISDPGTTGSATVAYTVTDGLSDLDYVALYFRKDGRGTFNRYTGPEGTDSGAYYPQSGDTGEILFDATRMGGDGIYEFYTVGVDVAANRESVPDDGAGNVLADFSTAFAAGTQWLEISTTTQIGAADTTYDDHNLRIRGAGVVVTLDGNHSFQNVEILDGAVLTHPKTTTTEAFMLNFSVWTLTIDDASTIEVTGRGYLGGNKTGLGETAHTVDFASGAESGNGGSYGGLGGHYSGSNANQPNLVYGNVTNPMDLGSGGGAYSGAGGDGGGRVLINAVNLVVDGSLIANGGLSTGSASGEGSGGTINLRARTLSGSGVLQTNGGTTDGANHTGGGGGRIAIRYLDLATYDLTGLSASGGDGLYGDGADGTIFLLQENEANGELVINGQGSGSAYTELVLPQGYTFDTIILQNGARVIAQAPISVSGTLRLSGESVLTHSASNETGLQIEAGRVEVEAGSAIDVSGRGYPGGNASGYGQSGATLGGLQGSANGCGGSYGGRGARFSGAGGQPNREYGDPKRPDKLGSGGGAYSGNGGFGGGYVRILASEAVVVDGAIRADGGLSGGSASGEGSGGSVWITTSQLSGSGVITANGGSTGGSYHTSGGGGRVAIYLDYVDPTEDLNGLRNVTALSGQGQYDHLPSAAGTVFVKYSDQTYGDLIIDDNVTDATAAAGTQLPVMGPGTAAAVTADSLGGDGSVAWPINGLVGLRINPDVDQEESFVIVSNTAEVLTVTSPNENGVAFMDVAVAGATYAGVWTFDNLLFRRGGNLEVGDRLAVTDTVEIGEYGLLTHPETDTVYAARLDLTVDTLLIDTTGRVDVTGRGYLGGNKTGLGETAHTVGFAAGAQSGNGGSHGGLGGHYSGSEGHQANPVYGDPTNPVDLGSGGGAYSGNGGDGGGRIFITASAITVDGAIRADGGLSAGSAAGNGSGGTVNIDTEALSGGGTIEASGGGSNNGTGGGGGRIAIRYQDAAAFTLPAENIQALGGDGYYGDGADGSVQLSGP